MQLGSQKWTKESQSEQKKGIMFRMRKLNLNRSLLSKTWDVVMLFNGVSHISVLITYIYFFKNSGFFN